MPASGKWATGFNRNILGCKVFYGFYRWLAVVFDLIETYWDVKVERGQGTRTDLMI